MPNQQSVARADITAFTNSNSTYEPTNFGLRGQMMVVTHEYKFQKHLQVLIGLHKFQQQVLF
jgi:hypothetical protein